MNYITCPHCGESYPEFDAAHVCSRGPYAVKLQSDTNTNSKERIRELVKQAGGEFWQRLENDVVNPEAFVTFDPPELLTKFAELIVKECAGIADEPTSRPFKSYGEKIKQHFGVE